MSVRVGINGLGRIGRNYLRYSLDADDLEVVAVNDIADATALARLLRHDSTFGPLRHVVDVSDVSLVVDGQKVAVSSERDPSALTWRDAGADVVIESTGKFRSRATAGKHLSAGARTVIISAPGKDVDTTIVIGVNEKSFDPQQHRVISNASCTTNCVAPMAKVLQDAFGIERAVMTTVQRSKRLGRAAQGSSSRAVGRRQHHPDHDRRSSRRRLGVARVGRSARRCGAAGPGSERIAGGPRRAARPRRHRC